MGLMDTLRMAFGLVTGRKGVGSVAELWDSLGGDGLGRWIFHTAVSFLSPYTGSIRGRVRSLTAEECYMVMQERRALRNPFNSIHAVALVNLAEAASGLAAMYKLGNTYRVILTDIDSHFESKARGLIHAKATVPEIEREDESLFVRIPVVLTDDKGMDVARMVCKWRVSPKPSPKLASSSSDESSKTK